MNERNNKLLRDHLIVDPLHMRGASRLCRPKKKGIIAPVLPLLMSGSVFEYNCGFEGMCTVK